MDFTAYKGRAFWFFHIHFSRLEPVHAVHMYMVSAAWGRVYWILDCCLLEPVHVVHMYMVSAAWGRVYWILDCCLLEPVHVVHMYNTITS